MAVKIIVIVVFLFLLLVLGGRLLRSSASVAGRLLLRIMGGVLMLALFNAVASGFDCFLPINPYTVLYCGLLGLPGLVSLCYLKIWL